MVHFHNKKARNTTNYYKYLCQLLKRHFKEVREITPLNYSLRSRSAKRLDPDPGSNEFGSTTLVV
jgi:hypothetical protein